MRLNFMPKTRPGKWSVGIGIALVVLTALSVLFAVAIGGDPAVIAGNPFLSMLANILSVMFTLAGPLSFFVGIFAIVKYKDWSVCKSLGVLYGLTLLLFLLGEFLFPH
jgi:hypothetical protein